MSYWLFQGNPKYFRVLQAIRDFEQMYWAMTRYAQDIVPGDGVLLWKAGEKAGIYAIAEVIEPAQHLTEELDLGYWFEQSQNRQDTPQCKIRFTHKLLEKPLLKEQLKADSVLQDLAVIRQPNGTNYKVTPKQWQRVYEFLLYGDSN